MFKSFIAPIQSWLLTHQQCVGCGMPLKKGLTRKGKNGASLMICKCGRGYIQMSNNQFRRAKMSEMSD
ncbi:MAG TPA: hypothetical protein DCW55_02400 [Candidatus Pacebacteria bacterium]|nr:MAG: hypothetical protein A2378_03960 [Candidatus Pacebacteria bacterium RIFOXYB1_FULL_44_10]HAU99060.1 hypothetical protein [Candidatus Paceibacterota bacterium]HAX01225.1 hypothetical protein [Candidatus Paceibacterota bacterium]